MHPNIKLVCFDLDDTLIAESSWLVLSRALGVEEKDKQLYQDYHAGRISYEQWNDRILEAYLEHEDATREGITRAFTNLKYSEGAKDAVAYCKNAGYQVALISGSIDIVVDQIAKDLGIPYAKANNTFIFDDSGRLHGIHTEGDDRIKKADHLEAFCALLNIKITECACIGDGDNDLEMFRRTGKGITFKGSPIEKDAWKVINSLHDIPKVL